MTTQTSIGIPDDLAAELYRRAPQPDARTALIAEALRYFFATHDAANSDLEILNRYTGFRIHQPAIQGDPEFSLW